MANEVLRRLSSSNLTKGNRGNDSVDFRTHSSEGHSILYRYGHEIAGGLGSSLPPLGGSQEGLYSNESNKNFEDDSILSQISSVSKIRPKSLKVVSGSQFRLTTKTWSQCEQCELLDRANKKNKELIRSLKLQLARVEESFRDLKYSRSLEQSLQEAKSSTEADQKGTENGAPSRKVERLEEEVIKLKKMVSFERNTNEALRQSLDDNQQTLNSRIAALQQEYDKLSISKAGVDSENLALLSQIKFLQNERDSLQADLEDKNKISLSRQNSEEIYITEVQRLTKEVERIDAQNKGFQATIQQKQALIGQYENKLLTLNGTISQLDDKISNHQNEIVSVNNQLKASQDQVTTFRKRCEALENSLKTTTQEKDNLKSTVSEKESIIADKCKKIESLEAEVRNQVGKMNDLLKRIALESESTKKALEKSIASSVRLCVVAPTVNVHVSEGRAKFKSKLSEQALKTFLQNEVFDKYCFLFKQQAENASPIPSESLETWLQKMLAQMQTSIENHVNSAMDGSSM